MLFALPVAVRRCARNPRRLVVVSATGEVLLRTLSLSLREQDIAERFARAMNEWAAADDPSSPSRSPQDPQDRMAPFRYGLAKLASETDATPWDAA